MTTMRHRFDKENKEKKENDETPEERAARVERLLDASAGWEPEREVPDDLVARAAARIERERNASAWNRFRFAQPWWNISALGLTAAAAVIFIAARASTPSERLYITPPGDVAYIWRAQPDIIPGDDTPSYQTVAAMPEGVAQPVMPVRTMSPSGYITRLAPPGQITFAVVVGEPADLKKPVATAPRNPATNQAGNHRKNGSSSKRPKYPILKSKDVEELALPPVWQEETVTRQDYRVAVPVILAPNDADASNSEGIPAVVEMTFEPPTVPLRSTFDE